MGFYPCYVVHEEGAILAYPHYSDPTWNEAQTIYGGPAKGIHYDYDDRLQQWSREKDDAGRKSATDAKKHPNTAGWWKAYLEGYHGKPVTLNHILAGVNLGNGYPYYVLGYKVSNKEKA